MKIREGRKRELVYLPKSQSFKTAVSGSNKRFCGLISRWQIPKEWISGSSICHWDFPGKSTGVGCHFLLQGDLPDSGIEPRSPAL